MSTTMDLVRYSAAKTISLQLSMWRMRDGHAIVVTTTINLLTGLGTRTPLVGSVTL